MIYLCCAFIFSSCDKKTSANQQNWESLEEKLQIADSLNTTGDYVHALDTLLSISHEIDRDTETPDFIIVKAYFLMGRIHSIYGDTKAAETFYEKALRHISPEIENGLKLKLYSNLYESYASQGEFLNARTAIDSLYNLDIKPERRKLFHYNFSSGDLAQKEKRYEDALGFYYKSMEYIDGTEVPDKMLSFPYSEMAETYRKMGKMDSAYFYLKKFEEIAEKDSEPFVKASALRELMMWSAKMGHPEMTSDYMDQYFNYMDSLINMRSFLRVKENLREYQEAASSDKIHDMTEKVSRGRKMIVNLFGILLAIIALGVFIIRHSITVRRNNKILYEKNKELSDIEAKYQELLIATQIAKEEEPAEAAESEREFNSNEKNEEENNAKEKANESLTDETSKELLALIMKEMEENKPYLDPDFSLQTLATMVNSNTKYVSTAINDYVGQNFRSFINNYRIKEAERRLLDKKNYGHYTMEAIANSVGIKSKSTFVAAFKKSTGLTPSVFLKLSKEQEKKAK